MVSNSQKSQLAAKTRATVEPGQKQKSLLATKSRATMEPRHLQDLALGLPTFDLLHESAKGIFATAPGNAVIEPDTSSSHTPPRPEEGPNKAQCMTGGSIPSYLRVLAPMPLRMLRLIRLTQRVQVPN